MNTHYNLKTDGAYLKKISDEPSYHFFKFFIEAPGNNEANNSLVMGTMSGDAKMIVQSIQEGRVDTARFSFRFDDNDDTEIYWWTADEWHCIITVHNEGKSVIYTKTHPRNRKESAEYVFHPFSS